MKEYEVVLDLPLLDKWCAHNRGESVDDPYFATILGEVFLAGVTPEVEDFLRRFSQFYDASLFENLMRICDQTPLKDDVEHWIFADLRAKRGLFENDEDGGAIVPLIDNPQLQYAESRDQWYNALIGSQNHSLAYDILSDCASDYIHAQGLGELIEPLYHICNSYDLVYGILAKMMNCSVDFGNYFEVYLRGTDYLFDNNSILVIKHADVG